MSNTPGRRRHRTGHAALSAITWACLLPFAALGQDSPPPPDQSPAQPEAQPEVQDRGPALRDRLQRRLDDIAGEQARLRQAIEMLDKGASREQVLQTLGPPRQEGDRPGPNDRPRDRHNERRPDDREGAGPDAGDGPPPDSGAPDRPRDSGRMDWRNPDQRERALAFMREKLPELADRFAKLKETNPQMADRIGSRAGPRIMEIMELQGRDPELATLKLDELRNGLAIAEAVQQARARADDPEKLASARAALAQHVADQFDIRARLHKHEIGQLRKRLDRLQADLDDALGKRDDTIRRRTDDMLSGKEKMDLFGGPGHGPGRDGPPHEPGRDGDPDPQRPDGQPRDQNPPPRPPR